MNTPFPDKFRTLSLSISDVLNVGYINIGDVISESVSITLDGCYDIISSDYDIILIDESTIDIFNDSSIGDYIICWDQYVTLSSSSSSGSDYRLKQLLNSGQYTTIQISMVTQ